MTKILKFPEQKKIVVNSLRQRVFYIGYRYIGPMLCQDIQHLYLKRKGKVYGTRWWSIITYGKYNEDDNRKYSIELEECEENDVPDMLDMFKTEKKLTFKELNLMGWKGEVIYSADIISLIHKCYNNVIFPKFVKPLSKGQFGGTSVMIQSRGAINRLQEKGCYSFTYYKDEYPRGFIWMNLPQVNDNEYKSVPVIPIKKFSEEFYKKNFIKR